MLQFENLRAGYEGTERLHGLSAALEPGRLTAIIGPNGCGKTTLLKCAAGLLPPMGGRLQPFCGRQQSQSRAQRILRTIGSVRKRRQRFQCAAAFAAPGQL